MDNPDIKLLIDNSLLQNNERITEKFRTDLDRSIDKMAKTVTESNGQFLSQLATVIEKQGAQAAEIVSLKLKISGMWAKMIAIGAACATIGGFLGVMIEQVISK